MTEEAVIPEDATTSIARIGHLVFRYFEDYRPAADNPPRIASTCARNPLTPDREGALSGKLIGLDPGHDPENPGAIFVFEDGATLREQEVNLDVALRLADLLTAEGASVFLTRCDDASPTVWERTALANALSPDLFVSLHVNGGTDSQERDGTEVYHFDDDGAVLAHYLQGFLGRPALWSTLNEELPLPNRGVLRQDFVVTAYTVAPSALTESVYLTNPAEAAALRAGREGPSDRRQQMALGHLSGILNYFADLAATATDR